MALEACCLLLEAWALTLAQRVGQALHKPVACALAH